MLYSLSGQIKKITEKGVLLQLSFSSDSFVVLEVILSEKDRKALKEGEKVTLFVAEELAKDKILLYGFLEESSLELFLRLKKIEGIGGSVALALSSIGSLSELSEKLQKGEITGIKGLGPKKRRKLLLELTGTLSLPEKKRKVPDRELQKALRELGFRQEEISQVLSRVDPNLSLEEKISQALKMLGSQK